MPYLTHQLTHKIIAALLVLSFLVPIIIPAQHAQAQEAVREVGPNVAQNTINARANTIQMGQLRSLALKENVLDGIAYGITRTIIQRMVQSIVSWINSGFQGSPAFVTDLEGFLTDIADEVVGEFIYGSDLAFLCSPFELDVRIALATTYNNQQREAYQPQCTLSDVTTNIESFMQGSFEDGGWAGWFELTQGETNDPNKAYYEAQLEMQAAIRNAQGQAIKELDWGDGFRSFKICSDTQVQSGAETDCTITTPGTVIANQLNETLSIGGRGLIEADEINEILGALLAQLAQQALTGVYGLLGMGGNSGYSQNTFGDDGTSSYLDALAEENPIDDSVASTTRATALTETITDTEDYIDTQFEIASRISAAEADYNRRANALTQQSCSVPGYPITLDTTLADAQTNIDRYTLLQAALTELRERFLATTDPGVQSEIMTEYLELQGQGFLVTQIDVTEAELFIEFELIDDLAALSASLSAAENNCNDDN